MTLKIIRCPTCDSPRIRRVCENLRRIWRGQTCVLPNLDFEECPDCGERLFDHDAMQKIEAYSSTHTKRRAAEKKPSYRRPSHT